VYQDLFGAGSYAGKGITTSMRLKPHYAAGYRMVRCSVTTCLKAPSLVRSGFRYRSGGGVPSRYDVAAARTHRWARGDWQLLPWILGRRDAADPLARGDNARRSSDSKARLPLIGLWKMLDNLRRTLSAPAIVMALIAGWSLSLPAALWWTTFV
jgi:cyclic beta-1,2-glucan synthetase